MLEQFPQVGLGIGALRPPEAKRLRWNVDHLLDRLSVELIAAYLLRLPERVERELGQLLQKDSATQVFERGLGANDVPGNTHILRVHGGEAWWQELPEKLADFMRQWS
jgi:Uri superfamily endonuclease